MDVGEVLEPLRLSTGVWNQTPNASLVAVAAWKNIYLKVAARTLASLPVASAASAGVCKMPGSVFIASGGSR